MTTVAKKLGATAQTIADDWRRAGALRDIATAQAKHGCAADALRTSALILLERNEHLSDIAKAFAETGDKEHFKRLLLPCAAHLDAAYTMCGHLAQLYSPQAAGVAAVAQGGGERQDGRVSSRPYEYLVHTRANENHVNRRECRVSTE